MAKGLVTDTNLTHIGDVIRTFNGTENAYAPSEMAGAIIDSIPSEAPTVMVSGNPAQCKSVAVGTADNLTAQIVPKQNLHGYDKPWAGGNGKNLVDITSATDITTYQGLTRNGLIISGKSGTYILSCSSHTASVYVAYYTLNRWIEDGLVSNNSIILNNVDGDIQIWAGSGGYLNNIVSELQLELGSTATSYEPYSNICPISGFDEVKVANNGKNMLSMKLASIKNLNPYGSWNDNKYTQYGVTFTFESDSNGNVKDISISGTSTTGIYLILTESLNDFLTAGTLYTLNGCPNGGDSSRYGLYTGSIGEWDDFGSGSTKEYNSEWIRIYIFIRQNVTMQNLIFKPMIRKASISDPAFEPYRTPDTYTTILPSTVYGGKVDVTEGSLESRFASVDLGKQTFYYNTSEKRFNFFLPDAASPVNGGIEAYCSCYNVSSFSNAANGDIWVCDSNYNPSATAVGLIDNRYSTVEELKTALSGQMLLYKSANSTTTSLTPTEIPMHKGTNIISADCGDVSVTYGKDLGLYIEELKEAAREVIS